MRIKKSVKIFDFFLLLSVENRESLDKCVFKKILMKKDGFLWKTFFLTKFGSRVALAITDVSDF
jgi:hypothetical protein